MYGRRPLQSTDVNARPRESQFPSSGEVSCTNAWEIPLDAIFTDTESIRTEKWVSLQTFCTAFDAWF